MQLLDQTQLRQQQRQKLERQREQQWQREADLDSERLVPWLLARRTGLTVCLVIWTILTWSYYGVFFLSHYVTVLHKTSKLSRLLGWFPRYVSMCWTSWIAWRRGGRVKCKAFFNILYCSSFTANVPYYYWCYFSIVTQMCTFVTFWKQLCTCVWIYSCVFVSSSCDSIVPILFPRHLGSRKMNPTNTPKNSSFFNGFATFTVPRSGASFEQFSGHPDQLDKSSEVGDVGWCGWILIIFMRFLQTNMWWFLHEYCLDCGLSLHVSWWLNWPVSGIIPTGGFS